MEGERHIAGETPSHAPDEARLHSMGNNSPKVQENMDGKLVEGTAASANEEKEKEVESPTVSIPEERQEAEKGEGTKDADEAINSETKKEDINKDSSVEEEVAELLQNLANKPTKENGQKRTRRSARERKTSIYSDYETEFKGNWDQGASRKKSQHREIKPEFAAHASAPSAKDMYNGFHEEFGKTITENSRRLLDLLQSSAKPERPLQGMPLVAPAPSWKASRLSIAKFIESKMTGADRQIPKEYETAFTRIAPPNYGPPVMHGGGEDMAKPFDTARLMSLLSSLTNQTGGLSGDRQASMQAFNNQGMPGAMQQLNPSMLQSFLNSTLQSQAAPHYPPYPGMPGPPYHP